jgi:hypothetical protein
MSRRRIQATVPGSTPGIAVPTTDALWWTLLDVCSRELPERVRARAYSSNTGGLDDQQAVTAWVNLPVNESR